MIGLVDRVRQLNASSISGSDRPNIHPKSNLQLPLTTYLPITCLSLLLDPIRSLILAEEYIINNAIGLPIREEVKRTAWEATLKSCRPYAIARGFSSLGEHDEHHFDEEMRLGNKYQERLLKTAAAAGKTVEQHRREFVSSKDFIPPSLVP